MSESTKDFQTLLDTIASGVYGKDIRGAIHDALEWLYEISGGETAEGQIRHIPFQTPKVDDIQRRKLP